MVEMSREKQDKMIAAFIKKNGATRLPPDARLGPKVVARAAAEAQAQADAEKEEKNG
jgi:hypothetical protein